MSLNGQTQTYMPPTLDGLNIVEADQIYVDGVELDPTNIVPYTGASKTLNMGAQAIKTTYAPVANADVTNKLYVDGAVSIGSGDTLGIVNLNFVRYSGSISDTDLGTYKISSSAVPTSANHLTNKTYVDTQDATRVPYTGATSNVVLTGTNKFQQAYNATTSDTTTVVNRQTLDSAIAGLGAGILNLNNTWGYGNTNDMNGGIKTLQNALQYNSSLDANSYFVVGVSPTTYIFSTNWIINPVSGTTANISLDSALFYFTSSMKYVISFTGIYGTSGSWVGTVFNNSTSTTVSDAPIAITTTSQTLSMSFTPGSNNPTIYLRFVGSSGTLRWTNFSVKEADTEVIGNLILDSQINSNIVQTNGKTTNLSNALKVNQTLIVTASSFTTASLPTGVSASTLSGSYTLTAAAGGTTFGMWLGSSFTYTVGAKYTYTFTGFSTNATATQAMIMYTNTYTSGSGTMIGDYVVNVPIASSTVIGSFTATSNSNVVWNFVSSASGKSISFTGFTLTRADTEITGTATINAPTTINGATTIIGTASVSGVITATGIATGTPATTIGLNASNQLIKYANPASVFTGSVSANSIPYASSANNFANSSLYQLSTGEIGIGTPTPPAQLQVIGTASICGGTNFANVQGYMASGSLTLGTPTKNYGGGGGGWNSNTACLMFECLDSTEIGVHDAGTTVASFMYYSGNVFYIGRNMGFGGGGVTPVEFLARVKITGQNGREIRFGETVYGAAYWNNPNGSNTHWGYPSGGGSDNYIRGTQTYVDTPVQFNTSTITVPSGLPQNSSTYSQVMIMNGGTMQQSQAVFREVYSSNSVAWGGGVNISNAFYVYNGSVSILLTGRYSGYWTSATTNQVVIRYQSVNTGAYYYKYLNTFTNNTYNHVTVPLSQELYVGGQTGWFNLFFANNSGYATDGNDQLQLNVILLPVSAF